jgi:hypothetical protein
MGRNLENATMIRIKVVRNESPNAEGHCIDVQAALPLGSSWTRMVATLAPHVPEGHHIVKVERVRS